MKSGKKNQSANFYDMEETKTWNVAQSYSNLKIFKWLYYADEYCVIAKFGTSDMIDEFVTNDNMRNIARIKSLYRLTNCLLMIIDNSIFALRKKDKPTMEEYRKKLIQIEKVIPVCHSNIYNQKNKTTSTIIDEEKFKKILSLLENIKREINTPLNNADMIYYKSEEVDPDELMRQIQEDIIHSG